MKMLFSVAFAVILGVTLVADGPSPSEVAHACQAGRNSDGTVDISVTLDGNQGIYHFRNIGQCVQTINFFVSSGLDVSIP